MKKALVRFKLFLVSIQRIIIMMVEAFDREHDTLARQVAESIPIIQNLKLELHKMQVLYTGVVKKNESLLKIIEQNEKEIEQITSDYSRFAQDVIGKELDEDFTDLQSQLADENSSTGGNLNGTVTGYPTKEAVNIADHTLCKVKSVVINEDCVEVCIVVHTVSISDGSLMEYEESVVITVPPEKAKAAEYVLEEPVCRWDNIREILYA